MPLFKELLFNLLFILITTSAFPFLMKGQFQKFAKKYRNFGIVALVSVQVIFCISFSYSDNNEIFYDLRLIPVLLGGLYGGMPVSILAFFLVVLVRIPFGGTGIWLTFAYMFLITIIVSIVSRHFRLMNLPRKLGTVAALTLFNTLVTFFMQALVFGQTLKIINSGIYILTLLIGILISTYLLEMIQQNTFLQNAVMKSEKIEVVSHLAASVSHEVRNPLTVTRGFLQMLKDPSIPEEKRQFYLDTAIDELDRAEVIIKEYLRFSKPHHDLASNLTVKYEIEKALELLQPYANHFSVKVKHQLEDGLYVNGEASKFQQCLLNIMKNCIEAMPNGGELLIESHRSSEDKVIILIKDTGIGMSAREIAKLGEPYYSTKKEKGTGLGMMVVFNILNEMGGSLDISSKVQRGTVFSLTLPHSKNS